MIGLLELSGIRRTPFVQQSEASECALACLAMVAGHHGYDVDLSFLRRRFSLSLKGATLKMLMGTAEKLGFSARALRGELDDVQHLVLPAILHWNLNHFVVLTRVRATFRGRRYVIHDPARGVTQLTQEELSQHWTGVALELIKGEGYQPRVEQARLRVSQLWTSMTGFWGTVRQVVVLAFILQVGASVAPFYMQVAIDSVFPNSDRDLLKVLAIGFGGLALVTFLTGWLRSLILVSFSNALSYQITVNLFRHLVRLQLPWFEKRHVGDIISRFGSTRPITDLVSQGMIAAFLDGAMATITVVLMFLYSATLTLLALAALTVYVLIRLGYLHTVRLSNLNLITATARENSLFIETLRGITAVKAFGQEANRQRIWQRAKAEAVNAQIKLGRMNAAFESTNQFVIALERVIFIYLAIIYALDAKLTIGMIFAFQAYKEQFFSASMRIVEQAMNVSVLRVHLARLSDIALSPPEPTGSSSQLSNSYSASVGEGGRRIPSIELRDVRFSYAPGEPEVLQGISLRIEPGDYVFVMGPSGDGKTTLLKIMLGLIDPTFGDVLIDGIPLLAYGKSRWRQQIGYVAQDDVLFAGSLADNISFFDPQADFDRIRDCASRATIATTIESFPMGYDTLVGDMGSVLSGGQRQRVLLARALYPDPTCIFLDEVTAHLDTRSEATILGGISSMPITRVFITHRLPKAPEGAKLLVLRNGRPQSPGDNQASR